MSDNKGLDDKQVLAYTSARVRDAVGFLADQVVRQREQALKYYRRDPFGNEVDGRSQVVTGDVAQYIDTIMPSLMRIFASGDEVVCFEPAEPQDEQAAQQATDYINWIWNQQNSGFVTFHHWFKDGLLNKLGVIKLWWDEAEEQTNEAYQGLDEAEFASIQADEDIDVGEVEEIEAISLDPATGMPSVKKTFNVRVTKTNKLGRVRVEAVPPEEFLFGRRAKSDDDADVLAHRRQVTVSDLIAMGFDPDVVATLGSEDDAALLSERLVRFNDVDGAPMRWAGMDGNNREVELVEAYTRLDRNGDGIAELLKIMYSGSQVLEIEEVDDHPFACVTPVMMPHRLVGMSIADQTMDLQLINSTILRQMLDNLYLQNMPQLGAVENQVNLDDLLTRRPGGVIRMKQPNSVLPIPTTPLGGEPFQMLEWTASQGEQRTGATRYNQGLDANTLNKTASGINLIQNAAAQRIELIARIYAETGVKRAFRRILELVCKHQQKPKFIRLRNQWVEMDPRGWNSRMDMSVTVGLGNGNRDQVMAHMMALLQVDEKIIMMQGGLNGPLITGQNLYNKLKKLVEAAGLRSVEAYYTDPTQAPPQGPPKPDPKMMEVQAKMALAQQEAEGRMALEQQQATHEAQLAEFRAQKEAELKAWQIQQEAELERVKAGLKMEQDHAEHSARLQAVEHEKQTREASVAAVRDNASAGRESTAGMKTAVDAMQQLATMMALHQQQQHEAMGALTQTLRVLAAPKKLVKGEDGSKMTVPVLE